MPAETFTDESVQIVQACPNLDNLDKSGHVKEKLASCSVLGVEVSFD